MRIGFLALLLLTPISIFAKVLNVESAHEVKCALDNADVLPTPAWVVIKEFKVGQTVEKSDVLAIAEWGPGSIAKVYRIRNQSVIKVGDHCVGIDVAKGNVGIDGSSEILISKSNGVKVSSRYRPLVYMAPFGETASMLDQGENLLDIFSYYARGITERLTLSSIVVANLYMPNIVGKWGLVHNEWLDIAVKGSFAKVGAVSNKYKEVSAGISVLWDIKGNTKWVTHNGVSIFTETLKPNVLVADSIAPIFQSSIHAVSEYIFDSWNRLLIGPQYNFESQSVGGFFGYMLIWDHLHLSIDLTVKDVTRLKFDSNGYIPYIHAFWRF